MEAETKFKRKPNGILCDRSYVYSILKCDYGWSGCADGKKIWRKFEKIIAKSTSANRAAALIAALVYDQTGPRFFSPRIDGKPNRKSVPRDRELNTYLR